MIQMYMITTSGETNASLYNSKTIQCINSTWNGLTTDGKKIIININVLICIIPTQMHH